MLQFPLTNHVSMNRTLVQTNILQKPLLYSIVFEMRAIRYIVAVLFIFFIVYPTTPAFAAGDVQETQGDISVDSTETVMHENSTVTENLAFDEELTTVENLDKNQIENENTEDDQIQTDTQEETETNLTSDDSEVDDVSTDDDPPERASSTEETTQTQGEVDIVSDIDLTNVSGDSHTTSSSSDENIQDYAVNQQMDVATSSSTTTGSVVDAYVLDSDAYTFDQSQCIEVSGGSFYCSTEKNTPVEIQEDALYSARDTQGDMEIYFVKNGTTFQVTDNNYDDSAPLFDPKSNSIVWHRLLNDRYQIVSYDVDSGKEELLTDTHSNNMEPARAGDITVWQRWVENNWEIILLQNGVETQLTSNIVPDIGPKINGDYVLWHTTNATGEKKVALYNLNTQSFTSIDDSDDGAIENPRFILMYDKTSANGDTITKGVDVLTGEVIPLAAAGGTLPDNIPKSDQTGETRALIQQKTNGTKEEQLDFDDSVQNPSVTGTSTPTTTQDLQAPTELVVSVASSSVEITEESLDATSTSHIEDVVIPPLATTTDTHVE